MTERADEFHQWIMRRVQDYGLLAGLIISVLTIIFMLLPIYRKQVLMEENMDRVVVAQKEFTANYIPLIQNTVTSNKVLETKVDMLSQTVQEINRKLDNRRSSLEKKRPFRTV